MGRCQEHYFRIVVYLTLPYLTLPYLIYLSDGTGSLILDACMHAWTSSWFKLFVAFFLKIWALGGGRIAFARDEPRALNNRNLTEHFITLLYFRLGYSRAKNKK